MKPNAIKIKTGTYDNQPVQDVQFALIKDFYPYKQGCLLYTSPSPRDRG